MVIHYPDSLNYLGGKIIYLILKSSGCPLLFLILALLGVSIIPASANAAGGTDTAQLSTNLTEAQLVTDVDIGISLLTNRRKILTAGSSLAELATEDVIQPVKSETVMVIQSAQGAPDKGSEKACEPVIGLSYRNSTRPAGHRLSSLPRGLQTSCT
ncbi:MAG: hypothetical protein LUQ47_00030 [Methanotrichaceae archaeon]|nr:hypothetical protein [Methanotrichaceae archaeon]